eukprot:scaffold26122_cov127-Cylindrotheca_fusiformis.AAC.6
MKLSSFAFLFVAVQANDLPGLRGISVDEDDLYYQRMLEQEIDSLASAPTPLPTTTPVPTACDNILRECPENCFLELLDEARPLNCADPRIGRDECNALPLPNNIQPSCPLCCPDECSIENPLFDGGDCAPTPMPSSLSSQLPGTPPPTPTPTSFLSGDVVSDAPTSSPFSSPSGPSTGAPKDCDDIIDQCPISCLQDDEAERPLNCTGAGVNRPDCDTLPFPPSEDCPLCCPQICFTGLIGCDPTNMPTVEPTPAPSPVPTPCKNLIEECPQQCWEVDPFDQLPLCTDFNRPDCDTLPFPKDLNCPTCCPTQCVGAPEMGDCSPTPLPSPMPTLGPSTSPASSPSQCLPPPSCPAVCGEENPPTDICSSACITCPPTHCGLNIQVNPNCPEFSCTWNICEERPFRMQFLYRGGNCSFTDVRRCPGDNPDYCTCTREQVPEVDLSDQITCQDFNGGPPSPTSIGARSWIRLVGGDKEYFEGLVTVGSSFNASTVEDEVEPSTKVLIYEYDEGNDGPGQLLQEVEFDSSCTEDLYLEDTYGSLQLTEFESADQLVSLFRTAAFTYDLTLQGSSSGTSIELQIANMLLLSSSFLEPQLQSLDVVDAFIPPPLTLIADYTIIPEQNQTVIASIGGLLDGSECFTITEHTFNCPRG